MKIWVRFGLPVLVGAFVAAPSSYASPIFVANFSFETQPAGGLPNGCGTNCDFSEDVIPGWATTGGSQTGQFQPGPPATTAFFDFVPDGTTVAYTNGGTISQTVSPVVQLGIVYTLLVSVGVRHDSGDPGTEALVINGNTYLATGSLPAPGGWSTFTATYTGLSADVGQTITIQLGDSSGGQGDWDNVQLSSTATSSTPEPASSLLVGLGALAFAGILRRKRS